MKKIYTLLLAIITYTYSNGQIDLVKDLNPAYTGSGSFPGYGMAVGDSYFFPATDSNGMELWKTKGTASGTKLVKDITAGPGSSYITLVGQVNGIILFLVAFDDFASGDFWFSDGTENGTVPLNYGESYSGDWPILFHNELYFEAYDKTLFQKGWRLLHSDGTAAGTKPLLYANLDTVKCPCLNAMVLNDKLYFTAYTEEEGEELFVTDGTTAGTQLLKNIKSGSAGSEIFDFTLVNNAIFFSAKGSGGRELWITDGTTAGTNRVKDINPNGSSNPTDLTAFDGQLFFVAEDAGKNSEELWKSDGTETGTVKVKDIVAGEEGSLAHILNTTGNKLFFTADTQNEGTELWISDGTENGTLLIKDLNPGAANTSFFDEDYAFAGKMVFTATTGSYGKEMFVSDGTFNGTQILKDIYPGSESSAPSGFLQQNAVMYFAAEEPVNGKELYITNGTSSGTKLLKNINPGGPSSPESFGLLGDLVLFAASNGSDGKELWKTNGKANGTKQVADINKDAIQFSADPAHFIAFNDAIYFQAHGASQNMQLWKTDGTNANTSLIYDFGNNTADDMAAMAVADGELYLIANDKTINKGEELWKTDGTTAGTQLVKDISPGSFGSLIKYLYAFNNEVYFSATASGGGNELYKSDGTASGTVLLYEIPGTTGFNPSGFSAIGNYLYFSAAVSFGTDYELWRTDGTTAGTTLVKNINANGSSTPADITALPFASDHFIFSAYGPDREPYVSDGTSAGTFELKDLFGADVNSSFPGSFTACDGMVYFRVGYSTDAGASLWKTDGTTAGTVLVSEIYPGLLTCLNDVLYFASHDDADANESIWRTDGTMPGTVDILDIGPAPISGNQYLSLAAIGNQLYFSGDTKLEGAELYQSDGMQDGTFLVEDVNNGKENFHPENITAFNGKILMSGNTPQTGTELWVYEPALRVQHEETMNSSPAKNISVFPNPFAGSTFIHFDNLDETSVENGKGTGAGEIFISDLSGKILFQKSFSKQMQMEIGSELPAGFYLVEVKQQQQREIIYLVKTR